MKKIILILLISGFSIFPGSAEASGGSKVAGGIIGGLIGGAVGGTVGAIVGLTTTETTAVSKAKGLMLGIALGGAIGIAVGATVGVLVAYDPHTGEARIMTAEEARHTDQIRWKETTPLLLPDSDGLSLNVLTYQF